MTDKSLSLKEQQKKLKEAITANVQCYNWLVNVLEKKIYEFQPVDLDNDEKPLVLHFDHENVAELEVDDVLVENGRLVLVDYINHPNGLIFDSDELNCQELLWILEHLC